MTQSLKTKIIQTYLQKSYNFQNGIFMEQYFPK